METFLCESGRESIKYDICSFYLIFKTLKTILPRHILGNVMLELLKVDFF